MDMPKILLGAIARPDAYHLLDVYRSLSAKGYYVRFLKTAVSEDYIPLAYVEEAFEEEEQDFDLLLIGPYQKHEEASPGNLDDELREYIRLKKPEVGYLHLGCLQEEALVAAELLGASGRLNGYSVLVTLGSLPEHLTNQHKIEVYPNEELVRGLIRGLALKGSAVSVIASPGIGDVHYAADVVQVENKQELLTILASRSFRYDVVIHGMGVPRFALAPGERFKVEYQRYFAEFKESFLPFPDNGECPEHQLLFEVQSGSYDNPSAISYLFENTCLSGILQREQEYPGGPYKHYVRLVLRDGATQAFGFRHNELILDELADTIIKKLEE